MSDEDLDRAASRFRRAAETFERVRGLGAAEREAALEDACRGEPELLLEVRSLLSFHDRPSETLDQSILRSGIGGVIGRYRIEDVLGEGGMGKVYRAVQEEPVRREVALKVIKLGMDTRQVVRRFEAERQALARMEHPNVARVLDAGATADGRPYFVMELVRGEPIVAHCDLRHLGVEERLRLFLDVCAAVQHAHQKGVIHRDLKPSNILVAVVDGRAIPKVIDFGVAKALEPGSGGTATSTFFGDVVGTPDFMSPEQAAGGDVDVRSDVFALGVVLYELLTGTTPLRARLAADRPNQPVPRLEELRDLVRTLVVPRPADAVPPDELEVRAARRGLEPRAYARLLRDDLSWIALKALDHDPARRYPTVAALAEDLERSLLGDVIAARPPSATYRLRTVARRYAGILATVALVVTALTVGLVSALVGFRSASIQRDRAIAAQDREKRLSADLTDQLFRRDVDRGRLRGIQGHLTESRDLLWTAFFARPAAPEARWALRELMWTQGPFVTFHLENEVRDLALIDGGERVIAVSELSPPIELDARDGAIRPLDGPPLDGLTVAIDPTERWLVCGDLEGRATLWDLASRRFVRVLWESGARRPGRVLVGIIEPGAAIVVGDDRVVRRVPLATDREALALAELASPGSAIGVSADGCVGVGTSDGTLLLIEGSDGGGSDGGGSDGDAPSVRRLAGLAQPVRAIAFDRRGKHVATALAPRDYRVFDRASFEPVVSGRIAPGNISDLDFSADGERLLMPGWWDTQSVALASGAVTTATPLQGRYLAVDPDGRTLAFSQAEPDGVAVVRVGGEAALRRIALPGELRVRAFTTGGAPICVGGGRIATLVSTDSEKLEFGASFEAEQPRFIVGSPDGSRLASIETDRRVLVRSLTDGRVLAEADDAILGEHGTIRFAPSGDRVVFATRGNGVAELLCEGGGVRILRAPVQSELLTIALSPRGPYSVSHRDRTTTIIDPAAGSERTVATPMPVFSAAFSLDGGTLALGTWRGDILLVDVDSGESRFARGHSAFPSRIVWHPRDPDLFLTSSDDGSVRVWHRGLAQDLAALTPFGVRQAIRSVAWDATGERFLVAGATGELAIYTLADADRAIDASVASERRRLERGAGANLPATPQSW